MRRFVLQLLRSLFAPGAAPWDVICLVAMGFAFGAGRSLAGGLALMIWLAGSMIADALLARARRGAVRILPLDLDRKPRR